MRTKRNIGLGYLTAYILCIFLLLNVSCNSNEKAYLSEKQMQDVIRELHFADVLTEANGGALAWRNAMRNEHYDEILGTFDLDREEFFRSYNYYLKQPDLMDSIYIRLIEEMDERMRFVRDEIYNEHKDQEKWKKAEENKAKKEKLEKKTKEPVGDRKK